MQVVIRMMSHINHPDVPKPSEKNGWPKSHYEVLEPLWVTEDILPTNLPDTLEHQNLHKRDDDEMNLNGDTGWDSDNYEEEIDCDVDSDDESND